MKKFISHLILTIVIIIGLSGITNAQNNEILKANKLENGPPGDGVNESVFVNSSGNVGIGTSVAGDRLHIKSPGDIYLRLERAVGANMGNRFWRTGDSKAQWIFPMIRGYQSNNLIIREDINNIDAMKIEYGTGFVGIGYLNYDPDVRLHIFQGTDASLASGGYFQMGESSGTNLLMDNNEIMSRNNGASSALYINREGGDLILNETAGNVGIGTITPTEKLYVEGNLFVDGDISFRNDTAYLTISPGDFVPENETIDHVNSGSKLYNHSTTTAAYFFSGLQLPDNSNMLELASYWVDFSPLNGSLTLRRMSLADGSLQTLSQNITNSFSSDWLPLSTTTFYNSSVIDNSSYLYFLVLFLEQSQGVEFHGLRIKYITTGL